MMMPKSVKSKRAERDFMQKAPSSRRSEDYKALWTKIQKKGSNYYTKQIGLVDINWENN